MPVISLVFFLHVSFTLLVSRSLKSIMYRSYPNLLPVTNKYLAQKQFEKEEEFYKNSVRTFHRIFPYGNSSRVFLSSLKISMAY